MKESGIRENKSFAEADTHDVHMETQILNGKVGITDLKEKRKCLRPKLCERFGADIFLEFFVLISLAILLLKVK